MNLLVDMGNTRLKWAVADNGQLVTGDALLNEYINQPTLLALWQALTPPEQLVIACVTARDTLELVIATARVLWADIDIIRVNSQTQTFGIINAYAQPEKLGVDRWLVLVAARHFYSLPACVVDCGTAITVDLLDADGRHTGGFISAGLMLMKKSLAGGTNALPFSNTAYPLATADFTEAAIHNGTLLAAVGLVEQVTARHDELSVILTGGDAEFIAPHLSVAPLVDIDLVLRGLAMVAQANTDVADYSVE